MPNHSSKPKRPKDVNQLKPAVQEPATPEKDPAAVSLGRRGGLKGGKARAAALTPETRKRIAKKAAQARWGNQPKG